MSAEQKLTKKQRKGVAFRQRKGKGKLDAPGGDLPELEDIEAAEALDEEKPRQDAGKGEGEQARVPIMKRKRPEETGTEEEKGVSQPAKQKKRRTDGDKATKNADGDADTKAEDSEKKSAKSRFILFVGNLKYTTSKDAIQQHFSVCDPPPTVRLLTPKSPSTSKSKGCAFLEFSHRNALQQGLKLHQSELDGRQINVELTAGGGGKGENRLSKVKQRNRNLATQRVKQQKGAQGGDSTDVPERPQRHSTTSGAEPVQTVKRTWTVADGDDGEKHRGGRKHSKADKKRGKRPKDQGTGVNAIPVG